MDNCPSYFPPSSRRSVSQCFERPLVILNLNKNSLKIQSGLRILLTYLSVLSSLTCIAGLEPSHQAALKSPLCSQRVPTKNSLTYPLQIIQMVATYQRIGDLKTQGVSKHTQALLSCASALKSKCCLSSFPFANIA